MSDIFQRMMAEIVRVKAKVTRLKSTIRSGENGKVGFNYKVEIHRPDGSLQAVWNLDNLMPDAALQHFLASAHAGAAQVSNFYIGVYANERTPLSTDTALDLPDYGEIITFSEGSRQLWEKGALQGNKYDSAANPAILTATETVTARGVFMATVASFGSTGGYLWSAALAPSPETINAGSTLRIPASIALENVS
jgi:hypothetical protein